MYFVNDYFFYTRIIAPVGLDILSSFRSNLYVIALNFQKIMCGLPYLHNSSRSTHPPSPPKLTI